MNIDLHSLLVFVMASFVLVVMPGPNTLYVITRGITQGKKAAMISACGASIGDLLYAIAAVLGLTVILQTSATAYGVVKICGALYMFYTGVQIIRKNDKVVDSSELQVDKTNRDLFVKGFLTAALNPKTAIFFVSFFPQFIDSSSDCAAYTMLLYGVIFFILGLIVLSIYAQASSLIRQWLIVKQNVYQYFRWLTGTIFVGIGIKLIVADQR
ncbi:Leucine efflux protein [Sporomusa ovata DSM 2662]|uniref:Threonine/homoserine/homoserine lactone efflux protein n=1 Tax=Sporomusa ovata TaxID=2378 RepID=A0A0U1L3X2_9FIRM|nr:LysE family transporter [Sporomusa ovata]EQB25044.1 lysine exporter protein [Sporomusa ovata DSM 2662]CQR73594.1 threonine/homoserine/homoserine lactone efflux protein [Sporomusa ovata]